MEIPLQLAEVIRNTEKKTIARGLDIFLSQSDAISLTEKNESGYSLNIPSQSGGDSYIIEINTDIEMVDGVCDCQAYDNYLECKHIVAAALYLLHTEYNISEEQLVQLLKLKGSSVPKKFLIALLTHKIPEKSVEDAVHPLVQALADVPWKSFTNSGFFHSYSLDAYSGSIGHNAADMQKVLPISFNEKEIHWVFKFQLNKKEIFQPEIKYNADNTYYYRCNCAGTTGRYPMCRHVRTAFFSLVYKHGANYFNQFKDWTKQKNELLLPYGITVEDEEAALFEFAVDYSNRLQVKPPVGYIKPGDIAAIKQLSTALRSKKETGGVLHRPAPANQIIDFEIAYVFNLKSKRLALGFELELAKLYVNGEKKDLKKLLLNTAATLPLLRQLNDEEFNLALQLSDAKLLEYLKSKGYAYLSHYGNPWNQMSTEAGFVLKEHYISTIIKMWPHIAANENIFMLEEGNYSTKNCKPVRLSTGKVELLFTVTANEKFITISLNPVFENMPSTQPEDEVYSYYNFLFRRNDDYHILKNADDLTVMSQFANGFIKIPVQQKLDAIKNIIAPLQERYTVHLPPEFETEIVETQMQPHVLLKEFNNQFLMLQPQFLYDGHLADYSSTPEDIISQKENSALMLIKRNAAEEKQFFETLRPLHDTFNRQRQNDFFYVHFNEVMKGNWFLKTVRYLQENGFVVKGMEDLKRFRYNTNKPKWEMKTGSGIDWFDLKIKVSFGDEEVPFKDIRKAIMNKQHIIVLGDGTFGVLPEEWIQQFSLVFKMGDQQQDGSLRVSKLHFTLIDQLHNQIDEEVIVQEIEAKKQKLKNIENLQLVQHSRQIKATLRPYQLSGFQWMQTLDELGWGGCLADDMGLGKTLQVITFLQYLKEKYKSSTHLVVCPTSLIYNWENELKKFAPKIKYHIYYGGSREFTNEHFEDYDLVLTSYGIVRNDMEQMLKFHWHYVILDESQAIKNPEAQVTKAVQLLRSKNRLVMSGTPVQNNTFDLFAQFNFINPGLLGSKDFYKTEFANPIDKNNDAEKSKALRQLIYPFLLRRTKEQVAKDLPDKTETILWCQMGREQQAVYDDYKNYYRKMLMKKIEEDGMAKAGMYVLEGLLRLRQICDSPQLVKDAEVTATKSIKIDELVRELQENTGKHKLLVFSQFTEMLQLVKTELDEKKIIYSYLDGSTPAVKRQEAVDNFQQDEKIKVFLISLKAGGVGLNLTAADYVYIVDPWWNPAVEQQAIDRTHRIGQTKKIFAYKMICKDSVEEKIVQLQQRKKQIANDLVTEDAGFIKKLSKDDVEFLFS